MQKLTINQEERIETGAVQFNDDWPGLFIRSDDCLDLANTISALEVMTTEDDMINLFIKKLSFYKNLILNQVQQ